MTHLRRFAYAFAALTCAAPLASANVVGNDTQNFNPVSGASDFVTVQSSSTLGAGRFNVGLFVNDAANTLPYRSERTGHTNDSLAGMDLAAGVGILPGVELGVALPFVMRQTVHDDETRGEFAENGNTGVRVSVKWAFLRGGRFGLAVIGSTMVDRVQDDPHTGESNATVYNGEIAGDARAGRATFGLNLGYRAREAGERVEGALIAPLGPQLLASLAANYKVTSKLALVAETYGARPVTDPERETDRSASSAEALAGVRYAFTPQLLGHAGVGSGLMHGLSTPDWRIYAGIVTELGPSADSPGRTVAEKRRAHARRNAATPPAEDPGQPATNAEALAQVPTAEPDEVFVLHNINFEFDSDYRVLPGAIAELQKLAGRLAEHPGAQIVVEGHCDFMGTDDYNDNLSLRRARTVRHQLIKFNDMQSDKIVAVGYGKRRPMTNDASDYGRQQNRRVEIKVYYADSVAHH